VIADDCFVIGTRKTVKVSKCFRSVNKKKKISFRAVDVQSAYLTHHASRGHADHAPARLGVFFSPIFFCPGRDFFSGAREATTPRTVFFIGAGERNTTCGVFF
jgi:hypothetical protein